jgi:hypothetical protein
VTVYGILGQPTDSDDVSAQEVAESFDMLAQYLGISRYRRLLGYLVVRNRRQSMYYVNLGSIDRLRSQQMGCIALDGFTVVPTLCLVEGLFSRINLLDCIRDGGCWAVHPFQPVHR